MPAERTTMRHVREVLRLKFVGGVPTREIARRIGIAPSTVRTTIRRVFAGRRQRQVESAGGGGGTAQVPHGTSRCPGHQSAGYGTRLTRLFAALGSIDFRSSRKGRPNRKTCRQLRVVA
jgi:hypothetical protein